MQHPDNFLPPVQLGLADFVDQARLFLHEDAEDAVDKFIHFMLAGHQETVFDDYRVFLNVRQGAAVPTLGAQCTLRGDFDSMIGFTKTLPLRCPLHVFPIPSFKDTLKKTIHISQTVPTPEGNQSIPAHKIPNVCIGRFGHRHQVRLFFPSLYRQDRPPAISADDLAVIYNQGILPTVREVAPDNLAQWPPSYAVGLAHAKDQHGRLHFKSVDIPEDKLRNFARKLRRTLGAIPRLGKPWFQIEIRGTKGAFNFVLEDDNDRERACNLFLESINTDQIANLDNWHIDVGLEIRHEGHVVQWLREAHPHLLAHTLPSISPERAAQVEGLSAFHCDTSGHLFDLAGFRVEPGARGEADKVSYINVYTTDKAITYQLHNGIFRARRASDLYPGPLPRLINDLDKVLETFAECAGSRGHLQEGTARIEVRVQFSKVHQTLETFPEDLLQQSVVSYPGDVWWTFKYLRVAAIYYILKEFKGDRERTRVTLPSLHLGAVCMYMLNAVMSRPSDWRAERSLRDVCCLHAPNDVDLADEDLLHDNRDIDYDDVIPLPEVQGLYFVAALIRDGNHDTWRLSSRRTLELPQLLILYQAASMTDLEFHFGITGLSNARQPANIARVNNRRPQTLAIEHFLPEAIHPHTFGLDALDIRLYPRHHLAGPDIDPDDPDEDPEGGIPRDPQGLLLPDFLADKMWAQFGYDVIQTSPNIRSRLEPAHTTLSAAQQHQVTALLFEQEAWPFRKVWYRERDQGWWYNYQFARFFPPKGARLQKLQNFASARYFHIWLRINDQATPQDAHRIRDHIWRKFKTLLWLPHSESDRMWDSSRPSAAEIHKWTFLDLIEDAMPTAAPHIAVNQAVAFGKKFYLGVHFEPCRDEEAEEGEEEEAEEDIEAHNMARPPPPFPHYQRQGTHPPLPLPHQLPPSRAPSVRVIDPRAQSLQRGNSHPSFAGSHAPSRTPSAAPRDGSEGITNKRPRSDTLDSRGVPKRVQRRLDIEEEDYAEQDNNEGQFPGWTAYIARREEEEESSSEEDIPPKEEVFDAGLDDDIIEISSE